MRRKVKVTPSQQIILRALAETGEQSLLQILERLQVSFAEEAPDSLVRHTQRNLSVLYRQGSLYLLRQQGPDRLKFLADEMMQLSLADLVEWDTSSQQWKLLLQEPPVDDVIVQLTVGGEQDLAIIAQQEASLAQQQQEPNQER